MINHRKTWGQKQHLVDQSRYNSSLWEDDEPSECGDLERRGRVEETCTYPNFPLLQELLQRLLATAHLDCVIHSAADVRACRFVSGNPFPSDWAKNWTKKLHGKCTYDMDFTGEDLMARIVVASANIKSTSDLFVRVPQFFVGWYAMVDFAVTYAEETSINSCDIIIFRCFSDVKL
ncbi:hypothetical protein TNCV_2587621 [Trichonephila clavipes]|nr:hypothetical protein TNCV_2587621 [Trichonephila clavipes]